MDGVILWMNFLSTQNVYDVFVCVYKYVLALVLSVYIFLFEYLLMLNLDNMANQ